MNASLSDSTYSKVTRKYYRRLDKPLAIKGWYWIIPLIWLLLLLYGLFKTAPAMETQVEKRVDETLKSQSSIFGDGALQLQTDADGQNVHVKLIADEKHKGLIKALASETTCDTWLAKDVKCPIHVSVDLEQIKPAPIPKKTVPPIKKISKFSHDFSFDKSTAGIDLIGEVASQDIRKSLIDDAEKTSKIINEKLSVTGKVQKFDDKWAYSKSALLLPLLKTGKVTWINGVLSVEGVTTKANEDRINQLLSGSEGKKYLGGLALTVLSEVDHCNSQFISALSKSSIQFSSGSAKISPDSNGFLLELSKVAMSCDQMKISVEGHTDSVGASQFNKNLSLARANAVVNALTSNGVNGKKLTAYGYGEEKPIADDSTAQGRRLNRRIEIKVSN